MFTDSLRGEAGGVRLWDGFGVSADLGQVCYTAQALWGLHKAEFLNFGVK